MSSYLPFPPYLMPFLFTPAAFYSKQCRLWPRQPTQLRRLCLPSSVSFKPCLLTLKKCRFDQARDSTSARATDILFLCVSHLTSILQELCLSYRQHTEQATKVVSRVGLQFLCLKPFSLFENVFFKPCVRLKTGRNSRLQYERECQQLLPQLERDLKVQILSSIPAQCSCFFFEMTSFSSQSLDTLVLPPSGSLILQVPCDQQSQLLQRVVHLTLSISAENERGTSGLCMYQGSGSPGSPDATTRQQKNEFRTVSS
jgi:hypothetical protein